LAIGGTTGLTRLLVFFFGGKRRKLLIVPLNEQKSNGSMEKEMFQAQEHSDILMRNIFTKIFHLVPHSECNI